MSKQRGKRNVAFIKPEEPNFLKRIKQQIGYREPEEEIDAKRAPVENLSDEDSDQEKEDEKPQVIQLREGDLTEEEANKLIKDEEEKPADLTQKIVFKVKKKEITTESTEAQNCEANTTKPKQKSKRKNEKPAKNLLSFEDEDDEG